MKKKPCFKRTSHLNFNMLRYVVYVIIVLLPIGLQAKSDVNCSLEEEVLQQNQVRVTGFVKSDDNEPLIGVTISVEGTSKGVLTDLDGKYFIDVPSGSTLVYSHIGFETQKIVITGSAQSMLDIVMVENREMLEEVVVVGFGTQKKGSVIGSVDRLKAKELRAPSATISTSLAGRLAGVIAVQGSGEPGYDGAKFWIRGVNTFMGSTDPLILVDGVERSLDHIDPEEIEDFSILKDATATAVYGVRGANGVVLVTTRKGKIGKPQIHFRTEASFTDPLNLPKFVDGASYMTMHNEGLRNDGISPLYSTELIDRTKSGYDPIFYPDVNWMDELITHWNPSQRVNLNISGGSESVRYFVSGAFLNQSGMFKQFGGTSYDNNINLKRYNFRSNVDINVTSTTVLSLGLAAIMSNGNYPAASTNTIFNQMHQIPPTWYPLEYPDKSKIPSYSYVYPNFSPRNPYQLLARSGHTQEDRWTVQSNFNILQDLHFITEGLKLKGLFSFDAYNTNRIQRTMQPRPYLLQAWGYNEDGTPILTKDGEYRYVDNDPASEGYHDYLKASTSSTAERSMYFETSLMYDKNIDEHGLGAMFLYNQGEISYPSKAGIYESLPSRHQGLTGRFSYNFDERYFAEFNFGYNGSENFKSGKRFGFFPSYAVGWTPSKESFMDWMKPAINYMKIRLSHGMVGNDGIYSENGSRMRFGYLTRVEQTGNKAEFGPNATSAGYGYGTNITYAGNPNSTWEKAAKTDVGLELHFLKKFVLQSDFFYEKRDNIWVKYSKIPGIFGFQATPYLNEGKMENMGVDGYLEYTDSYTKDLTVSFKGTFTYSKNKILANGEEEKLWGYQSAVGRAHNGNMGFVSDGLFIDQAHIDNSPDQSSIGGDPLPGDIKYRDVNGDGVVDDFDKVYMGHPTVPEITYGFGANIIYRDFDFSFLLQGSANVSFFATPKAFPAANQGNVYKFLEGNYWSQTTQDLDAKFPRLGVGPQPRNYTNSSWWLQSGNYLRLKQLEFGYSMPRQMIKKVGLESLRFYANGLNLFTLSHFGWWDAESKSSTGMNYPVQRTLNVGFEVRF